MPVFVVHVREGYEDRRASIEAQMGQLGVPFEFFFEGDMGDLTEERLERWFSGWMKAVHPNASCAAKHLLIYERMVRESIPEAVVLEDDALLARNFRQVLEEVAAEIEREHSVDEPWYVSIENSTLRFVPGRERRRGQRLYRAKRGRWTGGYVLNRALAALLLDAAEGGGVGAQIDTFMGPTLGLDRVQTFWCEPTVVEQGSHSGLFSSDLGKNRTGLPHRLHWKLRRTMRELKYRLR